MRMGERLHYVLGQVGSELVRAGNEGMHKSLDKFESWQVPTTDYGGNEVTRTCIKEGLDGGGGGSQKSLIVKIFAP